MLSSAISESAESSRIDAAELQLPGQFCGTQEAGAKTAEVCRKSVDDSSATFYKWKAKFGGLDMSDAKRLKALEDENAPQLKNLLGILVGRRRCFPTKLSV